MQTPVLFHSPETAFVGFDLYSFGKIPVPGHPLRFGFQVDIVPSEQECRHVAIALVNANQDSASSPGFAVKVDLETGEVWDMMNGCGLIGLVEQPMDSFTDEEPMLLSWEVEHHGSALIPKLQIADEVFLYPALRHEPGMMMNPVAGSESYADAPAGFIHPAVWREAF